MAYKAPVTTYAVAPGYYLDEWLEENDVTQTQLAERLGFSRKHVNELVHGKTALTPAIALRLEQVTGVKASFWNTMEATFREDTARLEQENELAKEKDLVRELNVKGMLRSMRQNGFIAKNADGNRPGLVLQEFLSIFHVGSAPALKMALETDTKQAAWRQQTALDVNPIAVATWLQLARNAADASTRGQELPAFSAQALNDMLPALRAMSSVRHPGEPGIADALGNRLAETGVILLFLPEVAGARTFGVTVWERENPVIVMSLRGKTDSQFWFTLFHEIGHVLLHAGKSTDPAIDGLEAGDPREAEADAFANDILIPPSERERLRRARKLDDVRSLAVELGTSPGVLVGYLHHENVWPHNRGRGLYATMDISKTTAHAGK